MIGAILSDLNTSDAFRGQSDGFRLHIIRGKFRHLSTMKVIVTDLGGKVTDLGCISYEENFGI